MQATLAYSEARTFLINVGDMLLGSSFRVWQDDDKADPSFLSHYPTQMFPLEGRGGPMTDPKVRESLS